MAHRVRPAAFRRGLIVGFATASLFGGGLAVDHIPALLPASLAAEAPKTIASAHCTRFPDIDGVLGDGEWKEAATLTFDMSMAQLHPLAAKEKRVCELRIMNSANNLYLSLRVPNSAAHESVDPVDIDLASVGFCQGNGVAKGDDRKVILAGGYYQDKHVVGPGKDAEDPQQDGQGAVAYAKGHYTFEWAIPLGSKDANDLQAKPGDEFRFNMVFIDRFQAEFKDTVGGGLYGLDLDNATAWGKLKLADGVKKVERSTSGAISTADTSSGPSSRPFHMGFSRWPADLTLDGVMTAQNFAHQHGDIVEVVFNGGIPWPEALDDKPFSQAVQNILNYRPPQGKKLFLYIGALNTNRSDMVNYFGENEGMPLPKPWDTYTLNSPQVKRAYANFVLRAVKSMTPDYLAIGIECNGLLSHSATKWKAYKELHVETYKAVKAKHPQLPVFFSTDVLHYLKVAQEARGTDQENEVADLMRHSDLFGISVYPHMSPSIPRPIPASFFDFARKFGKPIAVTETGDSSQEVNLPAYKVTLRGSEEGQRQFTETLLGAAAKDRYEFVIWTHTTDFEKLCEKLPREASDLAWVWAYTGMQTGAKKPRPALAVWDAFLKAEYKSIAAGEALKIGGRWKVTSLEFAGMPVSGFDDAELVLAGGQKVFTLPGGRVEKGTYQLDVARQPCEIDATTEGKDGTEKGIYTLDGDTLKLCLATAGGARPREFATEQGSDRILIVLRRAEARSADDKPTGTPMDRRTFRMGFTGFVYDTTLEAVTGSRKFCRENGDIIAHHIEGVPWAEALTGQPFPKAMLEEWEGKKSATPAGGKVYLAISPGRGDLQPAEKALPFPKDLKGKAYDDPLVKKAFLSYCQRSVDFFKPDYLGIGIEVNEIYSAGPAKWTAYAELHKYVYEQLKKEHKDLPIFASWTLHNMFKQRGKMLTEFQSLMPYNDIVAVSYYPFFVDDKDRLTALDWLTSSFNSFQKPYAMVETNDAAEQLTFHWAQGQPQITIEGTPAKQRLYNEKLLALAQSHNFSFVVSFVHQDYDALWEKIKARSPAFFVAWRDCGLLDEMGKPRPAFKVWRTYFEMPLQPAK